jgi:hypothetical protein
MESRLKREREEVDDLVFDSDDENAAIATLLATERLLPARRGGRRSGSQPGRAPNLARDFDDAHARLVADYFAVDPVYPARYFERRFRVPRELFDRVFNEISKAPYFVRKTDAAGRRGLTPLQKVCTAILMLASGACADGADRELGISDSSALESMKIFSEEIVRRFSKEYLRQPTETDLKRIMSLYAARGFPGCIGCIDCQHYQWEACPIGLAGQFKGKEAKSTLVLKGISDAELWIWHAFFGNPGSMNDINILDNLTTTEKVIAGEFPPQFGYSVNGNKYTMPYVDQ